MEKIGRGTLVVAFVIALVAPRRADSLSCVPCGDDLQLVTATEDGVDVRDQLAGRHVVLSAGYREEREDPIRLCIGNECLSLVRR